MLKRRHFLQIIGSTFLTLNIKTCQQQKRETNPSRSITKSSRKLALLIGINNYAANSNINPLHGCVNDVELQRHLLLYRYGFLPEDIITLTNEKATRQNILETFENHLINQAKPEDIVIFHYSGHGSRVQDPDSDFEDGLNSTIVPADSIHPENGGIVQDISGHTLFLLMYALKTENLTVIFDCCYSGGAKRGNLAIRAARGGNQYQISPQELEYQKKWLSKLNLTPESFKQQRRNGVAKGVVISATKRNQLAADYVFDGFTAGAFTYLMTQYLWQQSNPYSLINSFSTIALNTHQISFTLQNPEYEIKSGSELSQKPIYALIPPQTTADAVITQLNGDQVKLWLGGVDSDCLEAFNSYSLFQLNNSKSQIQLIDRQGLIATGKILNNDYNAIIKTGMLCQEQVRGIPKNLNLKVGIDQSLRDKITEVKQALNNISRLEIIEINNSDPLKVDCIFSQNSEGKFGLLFPGGDPIPGSWSDKKESISQASDRLQSKFKSLLALRLVKLMLNQDSSHLKLIASLNQVNQNNQVIAQVFPNRGVTNSNIFIDRGITLKRLPVFTPVQLRIENQESRPLYITVLVIDPTGEITILFPNRWKATEDSALLKEGKTLLISDPSQDPFEIRTQEPLGVTEVLIIASINPLRKALLALQTIAKRNQVESFAMLPVSREIIEELFLDIGEESKRNQPSLVDNDNIVPVDTSQLAALSITFEVT